MDVTVSDVITIYDRFADVPPHQILAQLELAKTFCNQKAWKERWRMGVILLTCHFLEREWQQDAVTGGMAASIAAGSGASLPSASDDDLKLTAYGSRFLLMREVVPSFGIGF